MSLPLTRRIARAALVVAAGAAPVVAAAGAASAAEAALPQPKLGGLSALDTASVDQVADIASQQIGSTAGDVGGKAGRTVTEVLPGKAAPATPVQQAKTLPAKGKAVKGAHAKAKGGAHAKGKATKAAPKAPQAPQQAPGPVGQDLPIKGLPLGGLPVIGG
ncbi:ATP-binding protein [Streptomyces cucumeris]|uniref:ATP-binding protein n=1 Tax=Streptomyces cucumeris TaxID=2962890 RepID=UPI0020C87D3E|nr:ATP-binding protein [Streptomyces sp. NEAU-Y11]MCP9206210.1 ATP-binding protein [Streptomyces sp. NEAU-Y11]